MMLWLTLSGQQRSAALKVEWTKIGTSLGIKGQTAAALQAFKKRNEDARRKLQVLSEQAQEVDFKHYRSVLKNQGVVDEIENYFKTYKPATYDVGRQIRAIEAFESQAIKNAEQTKGKVDLELDDLHKTLTNIEEARPFEDLTVVRSNSEHTLIRLFLDRGSRYGFKQEDVISAQPEIDERTKQLVSRGRWSVPGYKVSGDMHVCSSTVG